MVDIAGGWQVCITLDAAVDLGNEGLVAAKSLVDPLRRRAYGTAPKLPTMRLCSFCRPVHALMNGRRREGAGSSPLRKLRRLGST